MLLAYSFTTFVVGIACLGGLIGAARRPEAHLTRAFLLFYSALSVLVLGRLLVAFLLAVPGTPEGLRWGVEYAESIVGRYGLMFALPFFVHRLFGVGGERDRILLTITLVAAAGQHVTEFWLGGVWDTAGDVAEDVLFAAVVAYTVALGFARFGAHGVDRAVAVRFLACLAGGLPSIAFDLFLSDGTAWRFFPLWYCVLSLVLTPVLMRRHFGTEAPAGAPAGWGLTRQEERVAALVRRGLSNRDIGRELTISPNTVKSHLTSIFDKSGLRTRVRLVSAMTGRPPNSGPDPGDGGHNSPRRVRQTHPNGRL